VCLSLLTASGSWRAKRPCLIDCDAIVGEMGDKSKCAYPPPYTRDERTLVCLLVYNVLKITDSRQIMVADRDFEVLRL
jgi:hypothetical protein